MLSARTTPIHAALAALITVAYPVNGRCEILCQNLNVRLHLQKSATFVFPGTLCPKGYQQISKLRPEDRLIPRGGQINRWIQEQAAEMALDSLNSSEGEKGGQIIVRYFPDPLYATSGGLQSDRFAVEYNYDIRHSPLISAPGESDPPVISRLIPIEGDKGAAGERGRNGADGKKGEKGETGAAGTAGERGARGPQGSPGQRGEKGDKGEPGEKGPAGRDGLVGATGARGDTGRTGDTGLTGETGARGIQGFQGVQGEQGSEGLQGEQGEAGEDGRSFLSGLLDPISEIGEFGDFYINSATSTVFGPKSETGWGTGTSLIGPQGLQGITGPQGLQGLQGLTGPQGLQGIQGLTGPQGLQGLTGAVGQQGIQGLPGLDGKSILSGLSDPDSSEGSDGDFFINAATSTLFGPKENGAWSVGKSLIGPQGLQGLQGLTGAIGPMGAQGPQGLQGLTGAVGPQGIAGLNGKSILSGSSDPDANSGSDGDFYLNTATATLFGPKQNGAWNTGINLIGPQGLQGLTGAIGAIGPQGPAGPAGSFSLGSCLQKSVVISGLTSVTGNLYCDPGQFLLSSSWSFLSGTILSLQKIDIFTYEDGTGPFNYPVGFTAVVLLPILTNGSVTLNGTCCDAG